MNEKIKTLCDQVYEDIQSLRESGNYDVEKRLGVEIMALYALSNAYAKAGQKLLRPHPQQSLSEDELKIRSMTVKEREAALYGASLPKDSSTLKTLRMLCESTKSSN